MPWLRFGKTCKTPNCTYSHKAINDLSAQSKNEWKAHVLAQDNLFFNTKTVTCFATEPGLFAEPALTHASASATGKRRRT